MKSRYLTKSRFKIALECPTKLFYTGKKEYKNNSVDDPFLDALADGGFQVEELAKCYFPDGHDVKTLDYSKAIAKTEELLKKDKVVIYGAAILYKNLFIRVDVLLKEGNNIELIEVKAKSVNGSSENEFLNRSGNIASGWKTYLNDIAFQKYVMIKAFPKYNISAFLMLVDKDSVCPTDGLNQKFKIKRDEFGRSYTVKSSSVTKKDLSPPILSKINVNNCCEIIFNEEYESEGSVINYSDMINLYADNFENDNKISPQLGSKCKNCEFNALKEEINLGFKSGYQECFSEVLDWEEKDFSEPNIFEIWDFRKTETYIKEGVIKLSQITEMDIGIKRDNKPGLSRTERQWLQVEKSKNKDNTPWVDKENLSKEMHKWIYPLHFIDFETSMPAIPFNKGRHPYEGIVFQFSHHIVYEDGQVDHVGEFLNVKPGIFPSYDFIRSLKKDLEKDTGTIFKYSSHENTFLNIIYDQLKEDKSEIIDRNELCNFILSITQRKKNGKTVHKGPRNMVDLLEIVKRYYYNPLTKGSNSIKYVLPAILNSSKFLQNKYSKPIYGNNDGIPSLNFKDWTWIKYENGNVLDPYKLLPKMFTDVSEENLKIITFEEELNNGGAAMTAYARMQFEDMSDYERKEIEKALLKYCELDTMAMVMIYEGFKDIVDN